MSSPNPPKINLLPKLSEQSQIALRLNQARQQSVDPMLLLLERANRPNNLPPLQEQPHSVNHPSRPMTARPFFRAQESATPASTNPASAASSSSSAKAQRPSSAHARLQNVPPKPQLKPKTPTIDLGNDSFSLGDNVELAQIPGSFFPNSHGSMFFKDLPAIEEDSDELELETEKKATL